MEAQGAATFHCCAAQEPGGHAHPGSEDPVSKEPRILEKPPALDTTAQSSDNERGELS